MFVLSTFLRNVTIYNIQLAELMIKEQLNYLNLEMRSSTVNARLLPALE